MTEQPRTRSWVAVSAALRRAEKDMGNKRGKGRVRKDRRTRGQVKRDLRDGE